MEDFIKFAKAGDVKGAMNLLGEDEDLDINAKDQVMNISLLPSSLSDPGNDL